MKYLLLTVLLLSSQIYSQTFTKITNTPPSQDGGASRGVNWIDYDNDGKLDLFVTRGPSAGATAYLYHNEGNGVFTKITSGPLVSTSMKADGSSWGDFNNDGNVDLCVATWWNQIDFLFQNNGGGNFSFLNTNPISSFAGYSETCSWGDYNNDGMIDLYITNSAAASKNYLYKNLGAGNFQKIDTGLVVNEVDSSRGAAWIDIDNDKDVDLFICNENHNINSVFRNDGNGNFTKITNTALTQIQGEWWSASWGDYDNDGWLDVFTSNWGGKNALYKNNGNWNFTTVTNDTIVNDAGKNAITGWGDYDNDGDLDMFVTQSYGSSALNNMLYKNMKMESGTASFQRISAGDLTNNNGWTYGFAWGDYDRDGDLDIFCANTFNENDINALYRNDNNNGNKWLEIKCEGVTTNRSAIGSKIRVKAVINGQSVWQVREIDGQNGYCSQTLEQHFGLGNATVIDSLKIEWQSGAVSVFTNVAVNKFYKAIEGQSSLVGVSNNTIVQPKDYKLNQNFPNPFNPATKITFTLPVNEFATLKVFDVSGREVGSLLSEEKQAGHYEIEFDGSDLSSGIYFYSLHTTGYSETKNMVLLK
ncbi:MAG: VCBS repeat-containing protein [Bacteroidetes bacterium]|nr:VCBS repeat-containing protein [Bacteroidota bacterium]